MDAQPVPTPFIEGPQIYLRPLRRDDLNDRYLGWLNDPEVNQYLETGTFPYTQDELTDFYQQLAGSRAQVMLAIVDKETDLHVGNIKLGPIAWIHQKATLGILIGDRRFWGRGIGVEATQLMVEYGFYRLNLRRIDLGVYAEHRAAIRVYEKVGFQIEGRFREDLFHLGKFQDRIWMGLLKSEYKAMG